MKNKETKTKNSAPKDNQETNKNSFFALNNMQTSFSASKKSRTRKGQGISAGKGKTAGRGTKGQNARGSGTRPGFEGGQNPVYRRLPKRGFVNIHKKPLQSINIEKLVNFDDNIVVDNQRLFLAKIIKKYDVPVKLIGNYPLEKKLTVKLYKASANAKAIIEKAGGTFTSVSSIENKSTTKK